MLLSCSINAWIKKIPVQLRWGQGFVWTAFLDHAAFSTNRKRSLRSRPQKNVFFGRVNFFGVISYIKSFGCGNRLFESRIEMCKSWKVDKETEWSGGWWVVVYLTRLLPPSPRFQPFSETPSKVPLNLIFVSFLQK